MKCEERKERDKSGASEVDERFRAALESRKAMEKEIEPYTHNRPPMPSNAGDLRRPRSARAVTPAKAGVQKIVKTLDSVFRRNDGNGVRMVSSRLK